VSRVVNTGPRSASMASGHSRAQTPSAVVPSGVAPLVSALPRPCGSKADRLHPLIPRNSARSAKLYQSRGAVEREFGRFTHEWGMLPLRVRRLERVRLHVDLTVLAKLACRLAAERTIVHVT
jgi:hypothetical protein